MLYGIAEYNVSRRSYDTINYSSIKQLSNRIIDVYKDKAFSYSTLRRILQDANYSNYFTVYNNTIILQNNVIDRQAKQVYPFIIISNREAEYLIDKGDALLAKYYCYLHFFCGLAASKQQEQDFTIKQFLSTVGLSTNNNSYISKVSGYNTMLVKDGFIKITKTRDALSHIRNTYLLADSTQ